ncbi:hypothetical protein [Capnocytophaga canis]|uniref:hypothetical protein n=1 Tax=Capnocytophaga canis TaxID=1848903 RepID=UPI0037D3E271
MKKLICFLCCAFVFFDLSAQEHEKDSLRMISNNVDKNYYSCEVVQGQRKLKGRRFASAPPIYLIANNDRHIYGVYQLGKRGGQIYLYINILDKSVCLKDDESMDIVFLSGEIMTLKNSFPINCDGVFARKLRRSEIKKILEKEIASIRIYSFDKNYEFYVGNLQNNLFDRHIRCLQLYKMR